MGEALCGPENVRTDAEGCVLMGSEDFAEMVMGVREWVYVWMSAWVCECLRVTMGS